MAYSVLTALSLLAFAAAGVLIALQCAFGLGLGILAAAYLMILVSFILLAVPSLKRNDYAGAFVYNSKYKMNVLAYLCAGGFVLETVSCALQLYEYFTMDRIIFGIAPVLIATAVFAVLSAFSMALVGMSFGDTRYDFRRISAVTYAPLAWTVCKIIYVILGYADIRSDASQLIKIIVLICTVCFFYRFSFEAVTGENASQRTVFFSGVMFISGTLFFVSRLALTLSAQSEFFGADNMFALTMTFVSLFAFFFRKNIIANS